MVHHLRLEMGASATPGTETFLQIIAQNFDVLAGSVLSLIYPLYGSMRAIEAKSQGDGDDRQRWLMYWILYAIIALFELAFARILVWFSFWPYLKLFFTGWLVIPYFNGAAHVYHNFLRPQRAWYVLTNQRYIHVNEKMIQRANRDTTTVGSGTDSGGHTLYDDNYRYEDDYRY